MSYSPHQRSVVRSILSHSTSFVFRSFFVSSIFFYACNYHISVIPFPPYLPSLLVHEDHNSHPLPCSSQIRITGKHNNTHFCGMDHPEHSHTEDLDRFYHHLWKDMYAKRNITRSRRSGAGGNPLENTCEMALVSDQRFYANFGVVSSTTNFMIALLEDASQIYRVRMGLLPFLCQQKGKCESLYFCLYHTLSPPKHTHTHPLLLNLFSCFS